MTEPAGQEPASRIAVYAGSFDPMTNGHVDIVRRALAVADRVVVAVAVNSTKQPLFPMEERAALAERSLADLAEMPAPDGGPRVVVRHFQGLLVEFAREVGATLNVRGLRAVADYEYEAQMAHMNRHVRPELETVLLVPAAGVGFISSTLVREVARLGGSVTGLVPAPVEAALRARFGG